MRFLDVLLKTDPILLIPTVMVLGAVVLAIQAVTGLFGEVKTRRIVNRRLQFKERFETNNEAIIELRKSRGLDADGNFAATLMWFNRLAVRSGLPYRPAHWFIMSVCAGIVSSGVTIYFSGNVLLGSLVLVIVAIISPILVLAFLGKKRMKRMSTQLPDALQIVCRSLEAGHPVTTAVSLVAKEMPDPIGSEFGMAADEVSYGMSLSQAVHRMAERAGDPDVELFGATVRLQEKTGGNLVDLLNASVTTIRERQTMRLKVKAASAEGRTSAMILTSAPFIVAGAIHLMRPEFYGDVIDEPVVRYAFIGFGIWMFIGNVVMNRMINFKA